MLKCKNNRVTWTGLEISLVLPMLYMFLELFFFFFVQVVICEMEKKGPAVSTYGFFNFAQLRGPQQCAYVQFLFYIFPISQETTYF